VDVMDQGVVRTHTLRLVRRTTRAARQPRSEAAYPRQRRSNGFRRERQRFVRNEGQMTEGELRTLISNDVEAQALVAFAGESLTISTRTEALRAGDPLTTFKKLLRKGTRPVRIVIHCPHCKSDAMPYFRKQELDAALANGRLICHDTACNHTWTLRLNSEHRSNIQQVLSQEPPGVEDADNRY